MMMTGTKPDYFGPALIAGGIAGALSAIPLINFANCLCCLWVVAAGALGVYLLKKNTTGPISKSDGALVGAVTGLVAAVAKTIVAIPLRGFDMAISRRFLDRLAELAPSEMPAGWDKWLDQGAGPLTPAFLILGLFLTSIIFAAFGALGGVIGTALFSRTVRPAPPTNTPQPPYQFPPDTPRGPTDAV